MREDERAMREDSGVFCSGVSPTPSCGDASADECGDVCVRAVETGRQVGVAVNLRV